MDQKRRLAGADFPHRFGGEVGRVGLYKDTIGGHHLCGCTDVVRFFEGDDAGEGAVAAEVEDLAGLGFVAGVAVEDDAADEVGVVGEDFADALFGAAGVDDDGESQFAGEGELGIEDFFLAFGWGEVVVEVETDFADGDNAVAETGGGFVTLSQAAQLFVDLGGGFIGFVGVESDDEVDIGEAFEQIEGGGRIGGVDRDGDEAVDASLVGVFDDFGGAFDQAAAGQMAMGVDQHVRDDSGKGGSCRPAGRARR